MQYPFYEIHMKFVFLLVSLCHANSRKCLIFEFETNGILLAIKFCMLLYICTHTGRNYKAIILLFFIYKVFPLSEKEIIVILRLNTSYTVEFKIKVKL